MRNLNGYLTLPIVLALSSDTAANGQCVAPEYKVARDFSNPSLGRGSLYISIEPDDFTITKVICLSAELKRAHPEWKEAGILMFSSSVAATNFVAAAKMGAPEWFWQFDRQLRAIYNVNTETRDESLLFTPLGLEGSGEYDTRIDLPASSRPHCRLELQGRCVLALGPADYPEVALRRRMSATVTVTGTVKPDGFITNAKVAETDRRLLEGKDRLVRAALENLQAWWFEPAATEDTFRITFKYAIDSTVLRGKVDMHVEWPHEVTFSASSVE